MKRGWGAALAAAVAVVAVGLGVVVGGRSTVRREVAYVRGTGGSTPQIWLVDASGRGAHRLGPGVQPLVSPDGSLVAASSPRSSGSALILYPASGAAPRGYFERSQQTAVAEAFSEDSRYLAVVLSSTDPQSDATSGLAIIDTQTLAYRIVARGPIAGASFEDGSDRLLYGLAETMALSAPVDIHSVRPDGSGAQQLTHDGRSLNPVWGDGMVAFDREQLRASAAPLYQLWLMAPSGSDPRQLTNLSVPSLENGLLPLGFSASRGELLAEYEGQDTSQAWAVSLASGDAVKLWIAGHSVAGSAISRTGEMALVDVSGYLNPPDHGVVEALPLGGGAPRMLVRHGSEPSWNL